MSALPALLSLAVFLALFAWMSRRFLRVFSLMLRPERFKAVFAAHFAEEMRKAGRDPESFDLTQLRAQGGEPAEVPPEVRRALVKALLRTTGKALPEIALDGKLGALSEIPLAVQVELTTPSAPHAGAPALPLAIDEPSRRNRRLALALIVALLGVTVALALRGAA